MLIFNISIYNYLPIYYENQSLKRRVKINKFVAQAPTE